ncbi:MAG: PAS domain-containing protein [Bacillus subtilis]|nr:PAS domain-containing protein [Bacillus subtilis]
METSAKMFGFAFLEVDYPASTQPIAIETAIVPTYRGLAFDDLDLIFQSLPIDITYVDEFNLVRYYNDTSSRFFPRTPEVIGRRVEHCHPAHSLAIVLEIIERFKTRRATQASFWIRVKGRLLFINYYAVIDRFHDVSRRVGNNPGHHRHPNLGRRAQTRGMEVKLTA